MLLHTHFLCLAPFFLSFLSASESYFLKQYNGRVLNNFIKAGENRCILFVKALFPIESAGRIHSQVVCATGTLSDSGSSPSLTFLGQGSNAAFPSLVPTEFVLFSWLPEPTHGSRLGGFEAMWWSQTPPSKPTAPRHQEITG